jgi:hypothetical protein
MTSPTIRMGAFMESEAPPNPWDLPLGRQSGGGQRSRRFGNAEAANWLGKDQGNREREVVSLGSASTAILKNSNPGLRRTLTY